MIDATDLHILKILQEKARISNAEISRQVGMAPSAILERIRKLEQQGIIEGYEVRVNPRCVGLGMIAYVRIEAGNDSPYLGQALAAIPAVQEVHQVAGTDGYLVKIRVADLAALGRVLNEDLRLPGVRATRTDVVLSTLKETLNVPLDSLGASAAP
jgi:Lrp/AsnC family transcriptional regulator, leucine-responsive regulatory protein